MPPGIAYERIFCSFLNEWNFQKHWTFLVRVQSKIREYYVVVSVEYYEAIRQIHATTVYDIEHIIYLVLPKISKQLFLI